LALVADRSLNGRHVGAALDQVAAKRGYPQLITVDKGSEFDSKAMDHWAWSHGVKLDPYSAGPPTEKGYIESFNRLRVKCLSADLFLDLLDAQRKLDTWRKDYNE
jgi:putative transposase